MSTEEPPVAIPALFAGLVDDAAVFPPGNAPLGVAVTEHRHHRAAPYAPLVGRFLCPETRVPDWLTALRRTDRVRLGVIADRGIEAVARRISELAVGPHRQHAVDAVEIPLSRHANLPTAVTSVARALPDVRVFLEVPRVPGWRAAIEACATRRTGFSGRGPDGGARSLVGAKLRTGGVVAAAFPTERQVGDFITTCVAAGVPFKCTAGLHRAVRHTAPGTGFEHHGFLNLLVATHAAVTGGDVPAVLAERDGTVLAAACRALDPDTVTRVRAAFVGYGSCSIAEPLTDLVGLGLLPAGLLTALPPAREE